ncbi:MAG: hypothetical protein GXY77_10930 [Fibrobacter sp.]|nr:hypothetical protein [Fibrobacter sp.]
MYHIRKLKTNIFSFYCRLSTTVVVIFAFFVLSVSGTGISRIISGEKLTPEMIRGIRLLYPDYDPDSGLLTRDTGAISLELHGFSIRPVQCAENGPQQCAAIALFVSLHHERTYQYNANGNYALAIALIGSHGDSLSIIARSDSLYNVVWENPPHWQQALRGIDTCYILEKNSSETFLQVRCRAEYRYKLEAHWIEDIVLFRVQNDDIRPVLQTSMRTCNCCPEGGTEDMATCGQHCFSDTVGCALLNENFTLHFLKTFHNSIPDLQKKDRLSSKTVLFIWDDKKYQTAQ